MGFWDASLPTVAVLVVASFVPPLALVVYVRNLERFRREPMRLMFLLMMFGATLGVLAAIALTKAWNGLVPSKDGVLGFQPEFYAIVLLAPPLEELSKGLVMFIGRHELDEPEDGLVHGAAIGLGFAATENFAYGMLTASSGLHDALGTVALRVVSSTILHAGTTATLGFAYGLWRLKVTRGYILPGLYVVAVAEHSLYNGLVYDYRANGFLHLSGFILAVALAVANGIVLARVIQSLDADGAPRPPRDARRLARLTAAGGPPASPLSDPPGPAPPASPASPTAPPLRPGPPAPGPAATGSKAPGKGVASPVRKVTGTPASKAPVTARAEPRKGKPGP